MGVMFTNLANELGHHLVGYPLVNVYIAMEKSPFPIGKSTISMVMFHSYVSLPGATWWLIPRIVSGLFHPSYKWINPTKIPCQSLGL